MIDSRLAFCLKQGLWLLCGLQGIAWHSSAQQATELPSVSVVASALEKYAAGSKVQRFDSTELQAFRFQSLSQLLMMASSLSFKDYGVGRLSSISFRGTSPSHTAVLWNGININSATLGQSDFSTIPVQVFNQLSIVYGGASSNFGTDAIGGSIHLHSTPIWQPTTRVQFGTQFASFGNTHIQWLGQYSTPKLEQKGLVFYDYQPNCFPSDSLKRYVLGSAQSKRIGGIYDLFWRGNRNTFLGIHAWFQQTSTRLEPKTINSFQFDQSSRLLGEIQKGSLAGKIGFIQDNFLYQTERTLVNRWFVRLENEWTSIALPGQNKGSFKAGIETNFYQAHVDAYADAINEWRTDAFLLFRQHWGQHLYSTLNFRQSFSSAYKAPFAPAAGLKWEVINLQKSQLTVTSNWALSYHIPTLNERYWQPQGNPSILPENGLNYELGFVYNWQPSYKFNLDINATGFRNNVKNWIIWNPDKNYKAENIQRVVSQGIELKLKMLYKLTEYSIGFCAQYSLIKSSFTQVNSPFDNDLMGKQLLYVPIHTLNATFTFQTRHSSILFQGYSYSKRYTTSDNTKYIPAFAQFRIQASQKVQLLNHQIAVSGYIDNVFNTLYLNVENKAMPGRNFALQIIYSFQKSTQQLLK